MPNKARELPKQDRAKLLKLLASSKQTYVQLARVNSWHATNPKLMAMKKTAILAKQTQLAKMFKKHICQIIDKALLKTRQYNAKIKGVAINSPKNVCREITALRNKRAKFVRCVSLDSILSNMNSCPFSPQAILRNNMAKTPAKTLTRTYAHNKETLLLKEQIIKLQQQIRFIEKDYTVFQDKMTEYFSSYNLKFHKIRKSILKFQKFAKLKQITPQKMFSLKREILRLQAEANLNNNKYWRNSEMKARKIYQDVRHLKQIGNRLVSIHNEQRFTA